MLTRHTHQRAKGDIYWRSTFDLVVAGLNSPADRIYNHLLGSFARWPGGVVSADILYVALVAVLWFFVGKRLDLYRSGAATAPKKNAAGSVIWSLLVILYGLYLMAFLSQHNLILTNPRNGTGGSSNFIGDLIRQGLWLIWSVLLIVVPGHTLWVAAFRRDQKNAASGSTSS